MAIELGITGPSLTVSTNCCTGLVVIGLGHAQVASGLSDVVVAGACEAPVSPMTLSAFSALDLLSTRNDAPALASRPYDRLRDGLVLGEGGGAVVLEDLDCAVGRGATIYAEVGAMPLPTRPRPGAGGQEGAIDKGRRLPDNKQPRATPKAFA